MQSPNERTNGGPPRRPPARARILWPALGFPAVVAPRERPGTSPFTDGDATRCVCVLVLSDRPLLSKADAAECLRYVPWAERGRRHIGAGQPGSFQEVELDVRHLDRFPAPRWKHRADPHGELVTFGADGDGRNGIVAKLSTRVRQVCRQERLEHLHEIRVYESALARLTGDQYHLFWNNAAPDEQAPSDELAMLINAVARPRRVKLGPIWQQYPRYLIDEYEYEYGALHRPYSDAAGGRRTRAEVLHPLFVRRERAGTLRIAQLTDVHVDVRQDVYQENLEQAQRDPKARSELAAAGVPLPIPFNNWNRSFESNYAQAKGDADVLLLTGDLIDYGRGHWGSAERKGLGRDDLYHEDRNWFLFYHLLASGGAYSCPVYTILGNHDWRLNPYPPLAIAGAPSAEAMLHDSPRYAPPAKYKGKQRKALWEAILRAAHGPGVERIISYAVDVERKADLVLKRKHLLGSLSKTIQAVFGGKQTADVEKYPTETRVESVEWYLMTINPFLDYAFAHPRGQQLLMLDWAEDENVLFQEITNGRKHGINFAWLFGGDPSGEGPTAKRCLTPLQTEMVVKFVDEPGPAKVIGIHAPPIGPWFDWFDDELRAGWKTYPEGEKPRGSLGFAVKTAGFPRPLKAHPFFAVRPPMRVSSDPIWGMDASWNSFEVNRQLFIERAGDPRSGVRLVFSGHIHRNGLFATYVASRDRGPALAGQRLVQSLVEAQVRGTRAPAAARVPAQRANGKPQYAVGPLYVNTTSGGPSGHLYASRDRQLYIPPGWAHAELAADGTIGHVEFRSAFAGPGAVSVPVGAPGVPRTAGAPARAGVGGGR